MTTDEDLRPARVSTLLGDVVRVLAAVAVPVGTALYGPVGAALLSLVLLGAVIPRAIGLRRSEERRVGKECPV